MAQYIEKCKNIKQGRSCPCKTFSKDKQYSRIIADTLEIHSIVGYFPGATAAEDEFEIRFRGTVEGCTTKVVLKAFHDLLLTRKYLCDNGALELIARFEYRHRKHLGKDFRVGEDGKVYDPKVRECPPARVETVPEPTPEHVEDQNQADFGCAMELETPNHNDEITIPLVVETPLLPIPDIPEPPVTAIEELPFEQVVTPQFEPEEEFLIVEPTVIHVDVTQGRSWNWLDYMPKGHNRYTDYALRKKKQVVYFPKREKKQAGPVKPKTKRRSRTQKKRRISGRKTRKSSASGSKRKANKYQ